MANILATRIVSKCPELIYEKDHGGKFPFMIAAEYVNLNGLNFLLDNMEDPNSHINCPDKHGNTALILAIKDAYRGPISEVIQVLVKHGADIHYINPNTLENAWHYAFSWSNVRKSELLFPLLKILLEYEVSPDLLDNKGRTFFHSILISDNLHMLKPYITQFLEFFVSNNLERIFYCKNGEGLTVVELAEKLKIYESSDGDSLLDVRIPLDEKRVIAEPDNIHECNVSNPDELDISGSVSSSDDEYWQDRRDLLDIIIDFIKKLKSNELNVQ
ncbi:uncharacterized protein LOC118438753 [Folsomia candida]|uniref:uncharacterized protein LOC118438753 n=1 Tax=Folsomia candida TaxID=158441 RepID=UPI00160521FD|nr:uncharacterized protein LOC118438753 [Folsomia candida]